MARTLYFDIETSPMLVWTHYIGYKVVINPVQIARDTRIICIAYKWSDERKTHCLSWDPKTQDDSKMLAKFNKIAAKADFLCGHNGQDFDVKEIRTAIALRGLANEWCETPVLDTLKDYRKSFRFKSNRLNAVAHSLGLGQKDPMDFTDWIKTANKCPKALAKMIKYCKKDVTLLEKVHKRLDKYTVHDNKKSLKRDIIPHSCIRCKSKNLIKGGIYRYKEQRYQKYLCKDCFKVNMPEKEVDKRLKG